MRKSIFITFVIIFVIPGSSLALTEVSPANISTSDVIEITVSGWWGSSCVPDMSTVTVDGDSIYFYAGHLVPPGICLAVITPWSLTDYTGPLSAGTYTIYAYDPRGPVSDPYTFTVSDKQFVLNTQSLTVNEGSTATFTTRPLLDPQGTVQVMVTHQSGDPDISVQSGSSLTFNSSNYTVPQVVTIAAAEDSDFFNDSAIIQVTATGYTTGEVTATEADNDIPSVLYVAASATGSNNGARWADALVDLQDALSYASIYPQILEIHVGQGTYKPAGPSGPSSATFDLQNGLTVKGGFAGSGKPDPDARNVNLYESILSGDLAGDDVGGLDDPSRNENSNSVVTGDHINNTAVLDGFFIIAGNGQNGAGIYVSGGTGPTVSNCTISGNVADNWGGGIYNRASTVVTNCTFAGNSANQGGGLYTYAGSPPMSNCTFSGNSAQSSGGGLYVRGDGGDPTLTNCILWGNSDSGGTDESAQAHVNYTYESDTVFNNCCVKGWTGSLLGTGFGDNPLFASGPLGDYYLSQIAAGQGADSPCVDTGSDTAENLGMDIYTTRTDQVLDTGIVNIGYHYPAEFIVNIADLNDSNDVDCADFGIFYSHWGEDTREVYEPNEVGWWEFDEGAGSVAYDSSVYGRDGTLVNEPNRTTGQVDGALEFDGIDDHVEITGYQGITGTQSRTCAAWIQTTGTSSMLSWGDSVPTGGRWVFRVDGAGALRVSAGGGNIIGSITVNDNGWHHVAAVFADDGTPEIGDVKLYVDGSEDTGTTISQVSINTVADSYVSIGRWYAGYFSGKIDDVRIYDVALTEVMIEQLYQGQSPSILVCLQESVGDFNGDCIVNLSDLLIFVENWLWPW